MGEREGECVERPKSDQRIQLKLHHQCGPVQLGPVRN